VQAATGEIESKERKKKQSPAQPKERGGGDSPTEAKQAFEHQRMKEEKTWQKGGTATDDQPLVEKRGNQRILAIGTYRKSSLRGRVAFLDNTNPRGWRG